MNVKNRRFMVILTFSIVLTFGIITNLRGVLNPLIQRDLDITYSQLSFVVAFFSGGSLIATFFSGALIARYSLKRVFTVALLISLASLSVVGTVDKYHYLLLVMIFIGIGLGMINVAGNSLASRVFTKNRGRMMNLFHFFFGLGGFLAPLYANQLLQLGLDWSLIYVSATLFVIILLTGSFWQDFPKDEGKVSSDASFFKVLKDKRVFAFALMFFLNVGTELGIINWIGVYLQNVQQRSESEISFYISLFFVFFTLGRVLVTLIVERMDYLKIVIYGAVLSSVCILLGMVGPNNFAFFFSLSGLFITVNFPTMQAAMFEIFDENVALIISITLTAGSLGDIILGNNLIGLVSDLFNINVGFSLFILYMLIFVLVTYNLDRRLKYKQI